MLLLFLLVIALIIDLIHCGIFSLIDVFSGRLVTFVRVQSKLLYPSFAFLRARREISPSVLLTKPFLA